LGKPEFPRIIATKEGQPMPTPNDGVVKTDPETYPETLAGKTQYANVQLNRLDEVVTRPNHTINPEQPTPQMCMESLKGILLLALSWSHTIFGYRTIFPGIIHWLASVATSFQ